jgi:hypothetical protein
LFRLRSFGSVVDFPAAGIVLVLWIIREGPGSCFGALRSLETPLLPSPPLADALGSDPSRDRKGAFSAKHRQSSFSFIPPRHRGLSSPETSGAVCRGPPGPRFRRGRKSFVTWASGLRQVSVPFRHGHRGLSSPETPFHSPTFRAELAAGPCSGERVVIMRQADTTRRPADTAALDSIARFAFLEQKRCGERYL